MKKQVLFGIALLCSAFLSNVNAADPKVDLATYAPRVNGQYKLESKWLYSNKLNNYNSAADLLGPAGTVRGMAAKNGKMYFVSRNAGKKILVVNGETGVLESTINLPSNMFTYVGKNKAGTADSTYNLAYPCQDIKIDNAGNALISNLMDVKTVPFQIWKVNLNDGTGTMLVNTDMNSIVKGTALARFDAFGVYGDVNSNAIILAANANAMEVYKWTITGGVVAAAPTMIALDNTTAGTGLTGLKDPGTAPQVFPIDENLFYLDGWSTYPTVMNMDGDVVDGFFTDALSKAALVDSISVPGTKWTINTGHNGITEFKLGDNYYVVMASGNTVTAPFSSFRLFKYADANKAFSGLECLWTFPQAGMGAASNSYRTAVPSVEVSGTTAKIYVYTGENGYGMYEMKPVGTGVNEVEKNSIKASVSGGEIILTNEAALIEVYTISGQKNASAKNVTSIAAPTAKGIYVVKIVDKAGAKMVQKITVN